MSTNINGIVEVVTFNDVAVSAAQDLFSILTPAGHRIQILDIDIGQYSDAGDAAAELLSIKIIRGHTTVGSGGGAATPASWRPWAPASGVTARINDTTVAADGTAVTLLSTSFNVAAGFVYRPPVNDREGLFINNSTRVVVRISAPADALTMSGTFKYKAINLLAP